MVWPWRGQGRFPLGRSSYQLSSLTLDRLILQMSLRERLGIGRQVLLSGVVDASEDVHVGVDEGGGVCEAATGLLSEYLDLVDPAHALDVED